MTDIERAAAETAIAVGRQFRAVRKERKLISRNLAFASGMAYRTYTDIENGTGNPSMGSLYRAAAALGCRLQFTLVPESPKSEHGIL